MEDKIYRCPICGNVFGVMHDGGVTPVCCGKPMEVIVANSTEAATEKHIPEVEVKDGTVNVVVGSTLHPMTEAHYIDWVLIVTTRGRHRLVLKPTDEPKVSLGLGKDEKVVRVYAHCNIHGLWVKEL